jgi:methionyl aminopeptidase
VIARSGKEIRALAEGGKILGRILQEVAAAVVPGISTLELDALAQRRIREEGAEPSFLGYQGFPNALCTSVNAAVVHGLPREEDRLREGDLVGLDLGIRYAGFFTDAAVTVPVGSVSPEARRLLDVTRVALARGITAAVVGGTIGDIGAAVQQHVEGQGFGVVRQLVGHGVGKAVHEDPPVPNFGTPGAGPMLASGQVFAIEPMVTVGDPAVVTAADGWTVMTKDRSLAAHFEHTVVLGSSGPRILTVS